MYIWQWKEGRYTLTIIIPCIYIELSNVTIFSWWSLVQKGLPLNLVNTLMLMKGSVVDKNHNPTLHFTLVFPPYCFSINVVFFVMCWCTIGVGLQVLLLIDNIHLGSIHRSNDSFLFKWSVVSLWNLNCNSTSVTILMIFMLRSLF